MGHFLLLLLLHQNTTYYTYEWNVLAAKPLHIIAMVFTSSDHQITTLILSCRHKVMHSHDHVSRNLALPCNKKCLTYLRLHTLTIC